MCNCGGVYMSLLDEFLEKSVEELESTLKKLTVDLEEVEEERSFLLGQTGIHLPGATVKKYEAEVTHLKERIEEVKAAIEQKKNDN